MALNFTTNETEKKEFDLIEPGDYEFLLNLEWKKQKNGNTYLNCAYRIRKDVEQKYQGRLVFDAIYRSKNNPQELNPTKIKAILNAIPNARKEFEDYDELIQYLNGVELKATVEIEPANPEYASSKDKNIIKFCSQKITEQPSGIKVASNVSQEENPFANLTTFDLSQDLPF